MQRICSLTHAAAEIGVQTGLTRVEAGLFFVLELLPRSTADESLTRPLLLDSMTGTTPRVQQAETDTDASCAYVLYLTGTERLLSTPRHIAGQVAVAARGFGLVVEIGLTQNFHVAVALALSGCGIAMAYPGEERRCLSALPITLLPVNEEQRDTLTAWGIQRMSKLAELPRRSMARMKELETNCAQA